MSPARRMARPDRERGFTLLEVMITSALLLVVLAIVLPQLTTSITNFDNARVRSDTVDSAQLALDQIQHDVISSNVLYIDGSGVVHLQVYGGNAASSTTVTTIIPLSTCVEYQVAGGLLQRRIKAPATAGWTGVWSNVMTGIVNTAQTGSPPAFSIATANPRSLVVNLWVNADIRLVNTAKPSQFTSTFTGRSIPNNPSSQSGAC